MRLTIANKQFAQKPLDLPVSLCENILGRTTWPFPPIEEVIRHPVLTPEGELITQSGYRPELLAYVDLENLKINVPQNPSNRQVEAAKSLIFEHLLVDFPLIDEASKTHVLALGLQLFVRHLIDGPTPPYLLTATVPRTGKTLLVFLLALIATGEEFKLLAPTENEEEWRKRITALLAASPAIVCIDNINKKLDSASLASLFTTRHWTDRLLGSNTPVTLRNHVTWTLTANNPQASEELTKRCVWIGMDPKMENPEERSGFKHQPIKRWVQANRQKLLEAFLLLVQAWVAQGMPRSKATLGSFEEWAEVVGGILETVGIPGFLENRKALIERTSTDQQEWKDFIGVWWQKHKETPLKVSQLRELAYEAELLGRILGDKSEKSQDTRLGKALLQKQDRIFDLEDTTVCIQKGKDPHTKSNAWRLGKRSGG
jgi:putative DNA primase/helicase